MTKKPPPQIHCQSTGVLWNRINVLIIYLPIIVNMYPIAIEEFSSQERTGHEIILLSSLPNMVYSWVWPSVVVVVVARLACRSWLISIDPPRFPTSPNPLFVRICVLESLAIIYFVEYWEELPLSFTQKNDIYRRGRHLRILLYCWNKVYGRAHTAALVVMVQ